VRAYAFAGISRFAIVILVAFAAGIFSIAGAGAESATPSPTQEAVPGEQFLLAPEGGADLDAIRIDLAPGDQQEIRIALGNRDTAEIDLRTYAANAFTRVNGGYAAADESQAAESPATWLSYPAATISLAPGETVAQTLTITVPEDAAPGQYIAAIVAQSAKPIEVPGTELFNQVIRKSIPVIITVPGPVNAVADLGEPSFNQTPDSTTLVVPIANTGNIRIRPTGELTLTDASGAVVLTAPIAMGPVYAGDDTTLEIAIPSQMIAGTYTLNLSLTDEEGTGWTAALSDISLELAERPTPVATPEPTPVEITNAEASIGPAAASGGAPQYVDLSVQITNRSAAVPSSTLTLTVLRDGETVEQLPIGQSVALLTSETSLQYRYVPSEGWKPGVYSFELTLEANDPNTGATLLLDNFTLPDTVTIP
jgi:hypothetical protein